MVYSIWNPNAEEDLIEGLFSWGSSNETINKSHTENIRDSLNESINKTMMTTKTSMSSVVDATQEIDVDFTECSAQFSEVFLAEKKLHQEGKMKCIVNAKTPEFVKACGEVYPDISGVKMSDVTPCRLDNIKQDMAMSFDSSKSLELGDTKKVQKKLRDELESRVNDETDALGAAVGSIVSAASSFGDIGSSSSSTNDNTVINKTKIVDRVVNMVDESFITEMSKKMSGKQSLKLKNGGASFITQTMSLDLVAKMTDKNTSFKGLISDIEKIDKKITVKKTKGVTDMVEEGADTVKKVSGDAKDLGETTVKEGGKVATTGIEEGASIAKTWIYGVAIVAFIIVMAILWLLLSPAGQSAVETGANTGSSIVKAKAGIVQ